jgi:Reverse transcriptase (RNA-dependent DNA polymerase)
MEEVCELENSKQALQRVKANKGKPGVDGMTVDELPEYLKQHGLEIGEQLRNGTYQPQPLRRVEIEKPDGGGMRKLGIPTVLDRFVQQAVLQVLQKRRDPTFSEHSHGFRPGRSAKQAVHEAQQYIAAGYRWVVDLDLEKFFDRVNHDRLMAAVAKRVADKAHAHHHGESSAACQPAIARPRAKHPPDRLLYLRPRGTPALGGRPSATCASACRHRPRPKGRTRHRQEGHQGLRKLTHYDQ